MEYLEYNKFIEYIKKGNARDIINKTRNNYSRCSAEVMKLLPNDFKKKIKKKN